MDQYEMTSMLQTFNIHDLRLDMKNVKWKNMKENVWFRHPHKKSKFKFSFSSKLNVALIFFNFPFNSLNAKIAMIQKPINWFAEQINWLVSIWWQLWCLLS